MQELLGLDKQLRSIKGSLKVEVPKKVPSEERIEKEKRKPEEIRDNQEYDDGIREDIRHRTAKLNEDLSVRKESIDLFKGRLKNQITSFKETIAKGRTIILFIGGLPFSYKKLFASCSWLKKIVCFKVMN